MGPDIINQLLFYKTLMGFQKIIIAKTNRKIKERD